MEDDGKKDPAGLDFISWCTSTHANSNVATMKTVFIHLFFLILVSSSASSIARLWPMWHLTVTASDASVKNPAATVLGLFITKCCMLDKKQKK